jgi:endonuclease III
MQFRRAYGSLLLGGSLSRVLLSSLVSSFPIYQTSFASIMPTTRVQIVRGQTILVVPSSAASMRDSTPKRSRRSLKTSLDMAAELETPLSVKNESGIIEERPEGVANNPSTPSAKKRKTTSTPTSSSKRKIDSNPDCTDPLTPVTRNQELKTPKPPRKKKTNPEPGSKEPPHGWEDIYSLVEELRRDKSAPVDSDGGEALPQRHLGEKVYRFQVLIALMLSSQTKDAVVGDAMPALQEYGLTIDNICTTSPEKLNELIRRVGFHNNKTKYIKEAAEVLKAQYNGDIPPDAQEMMKLSGVGPKMAFIVENIAWNKCTGIGVDTHMHRMFNDLKWVTSKNPEQTRIQLESWLPRDKWANINYLWVGFGQEVQQFKPKMLQKALECSRPFDALKLIKRLGLDYKKEASKLGLDEQIQAVLEASSKGS